MKKTVNINLGGIAFIIDENAFEVLFNYLETLKRKFSNEAERKEILSDIESRLAEMLTQRLGGKKEVVSLEDVEAVIAVMGQPEDIGGEETASAESEPKNTAAGNASYNEPVKKRLYRDNDDKVVGGVIAGLCHYFGIHDPTWARILVAILVLLGVGTPILVYILLLIIVPKAETAAEKLQMKGEPVNVATIEKEVRDAANRAGESINGMLRKEGPMDDAINVLSRIAVVILKVAAVAVVVISLLIMVSLAGTFLGLASFTPMPLSEITGLLVDNSSTVYLLVLGITMFIAAPLIAVIYVALKFLLKARQVYRPLMWALLAMWWAGLFLIIFAGVRMGTSFQYEASEKVREPLTQPADSTLYVQLVNNEGVKIDITDDHESDLGMGPELFFEGKDIRTKTGYRAGEIYLQLMPSKSDSFEVEKYITGDGKNEAVATEGIRYVRYTYTQTDSILNLPQYYEIIKGGKWRNQQIKFRIAIPEGKKVKFADNIDRVPATVKADSDYDDTYFANTTWTVEKGKVKCLDCEQQERNKPENKEGERDENTNQTKEEKPGKGDF